MATAWYHNGNLQATGEFIEGDSTNGGLFVGVMANGENVRTWLAGADAVPGRAFTNA